MEVHFGGGRHERIEIVRVRSELENVYVICYRPNLREYERNRIQFLKC